MHVGQRGGLHRGLESLHTETTASRAVSTPKSFTEGWTKDTIQHSKMEKDIWHLVKKQPHVKLVLAGPWDPTSFLLLLSHARQVCLIFPSESCSSVRFTRGGSCWERDWETRICQRVVLFPTALADWPKSYKKKKSNSGKSPERVKAFGTNGTIGFSCSYRHVFLLIFYLFI